MPENNLINVGGRLHSIATGNNLVGANEVFDDDKNKKQSVINAETDTRVTTVEADLDAPSSGLKERVHALEEQVAFDGEFEVANSPEDIVSGSGKITSANAVSGAVDAINARTGYFNCNTRGDVADKVVNAPGFVLREGGNVKILMTYRNTANNVTLNINSTGAKPLYYNGYTAGPYNTWNAYNTIEVYYRDDIDAYIGRSLEYDSSIFILDVSQDNVEGVTNKTYDSLRQAINDITIAKRKSGMTIRYIDSTTHKYEQCRYLLKYANTTAGNNDFENEANWTKGSSDGIYDVSVENAINGTPATYETLALAVEAISAHKRVPGMSIKFIKLIPATYNVVKTEGVTEQPTGTELQSASTVVSGTYNAAQLSDFASLPATTGAANAVTYYVAITVDETTTYTTWVITKATNDSTKYVQNRYMGTAITAATFTDVTQWQGVDDTPTIGSKNLVESGGVAEAINKKYAEHISEDITGDSSEYISFTNDSDEEFARISENGISAPDFFISNESVDTRLENIESDIEDTKEGLEDVEVKCEKISTNYITFDEEDISFTSDDESEEFASIGNYGVKAKDFLDKDNNSIIKEWFGEVSGNLDLKEQLDDEVIFASNNEDENYVKIGNYGVKAKGYFNENGENIFDAVVTENTKVKIDISEVQEQDGKIDDSTFIFSSSNEFKYKIISIDAGCDYEVTANSTYDVEIFFLTTSTLTNGEVYPNSEYIKNKILIKKGTTDTITAPADAIYMYWNVVDGNGIASLYYKGTHKFKDPVTFIEKLNRITNNSCRYAIHQGCTSWSDIIGWNDITSPLEDTENGIRIPGAISMSFSFLIASGNFDSSVVYQTEYGLKKQIHRLSMAVINCHNSVNVTGKVWNHDWQAGLWATYAAAGVALFPELFSTVERENCKTMLIDIADYLSNADISRRYWKDRNGVEILAGDTKADSLSWDAGLLMLVVTMYPDTANIELYKKKVIEYNAMTFSTPDDREGDKFVNGYYLKDLNGSNYENNGITYNHHVIHPDYMCSYSNLIAGIVSILNKKTIPVAAIHNMEKIAYGLTEVEFTGGETISGRVIRYPGGVMLSPKSWNIYYPMGNDWGITPRLFQNEIFFCCACKKFNAYPKMNWEDIATPYANHFLQMQSRFKTGKTFANNDEDSYAEGREYTISSVVGAALVIMTVPVYLDEDGVWFYDVSGIVTATIDGVPVDFSSGTSYLYLRRFEGDAITMPRILISNTGEFSSSVPGGHYIAYLQKDGTTYFNVVGYVTVTSNSIDINISLTN